MISYPFTTITFNPAIDKSTSIPALIPEKKLVCTRPLLEPGGGGINVARAIKKLGGEALAIFPAGGHWHEVFNSDIYDNWVNPWATGNGGQIWAGGPPL